MNSIQTAFWVVALLVALALAFDFMNGFHDAANSIATVVSTGVLKPQTAVAMAAVFNFVAIFVVGLGVAATVGKGTIDPKEPVLVRVHSECLTGDVLGSLRCDCGEQLHRAMEMIDLPLYPFTKGPRIW